MDPEAAIPPEVLELAEACVRYVRRSTGVPLDYSQDTLGVLDHYARSIRGEPRDEILALLVPAIGAYFGEVVRREIGGRWQLVDPGDWTTHRLVVDELGLSFNPTAIALECVTGEPGAEVGSALRFPEEHRDLVASALDAAGPVTDDDYDRLAVRFEAIQQVVSVLTGILASRRTVRDEP
ncbi:MAG: hypothetical protein NZ898_11190 [Myxococcota bacterium]|nr:hypothetical protein [Myxococcota bacterium]MDW8362272.1 hypothetical protein [Myxococcales bacterium]